MKQLTCQFHKHKNKKMYVCVDDILRIFRYYIKECNEAKDHIHAEFFHQLNDNMVSSSLEAEAYLDFQNKKRRKKAQKKRKVK